MDEKVTEAIAALEKDGRLTPEKVVQAAKNSKSPLHEFFDWDNDHAAGQWRIEQARRLIRSVKIQFETEDRTITVVKYARDPRNIEENEQGYVSIPVLKRHPADARALLLYELGRASAILERAESLVEALSKKKDKAIGTQLRRLHGSLRRLQERVETQV